MKPMKCNACSTQWSGHNTYCPSCGSPWLDRHRSRLWELLWVAAALTLLILLA